MPHNAGQCGKSEQEELGMVIARAYDPGIRMKLEYCCNFKAELTT